MTKATICALALCIASTLTSDATAQYSPGWAPPTYDLAFPDFLTSAERRVVAQQLNGMLDVFRSTAPLAKPAFSVQPDLTIHSTKREPLRAHVSVSHHLFQTNNPSRRLPAGARTLVLTNDVTYAMLTQNFHAEFSDEAGPMYIVTPGKELRARGIVDGRPLISNEDRPTRPEYPALARFVFLHPAGLEMLVPVSRERFMKAALSRWRSDRSMQAEKVAELDARLKSMSPEDLSQPARFRDVFGDPPRDPNWPNGDPQLIAQYNSPVVAPNPRLLDRKRPATDIQYMVVLFGLDDNGWVHQLPDLQTLMNSLDLDALAAYMK